jgi:di/tricarboxylate transporter
MQTGMMLPSTPVFGGMSSVGLLCLVAAFFFTAGISVVTGGTSLLTVPVMLSFGVDPRVAVATNMVALIFLSPLLNAFDEKAKWPEMMLPLVKPRFEAIGFKVKRAEAWKGRVVFRDVGALVYWLKAVPWAVDNFSVDSHLGYLGRLQERVDIEGVLTFTYSRYLIFVWKPVG